jgi:ribosomal protein S18 acetylase RimI-like enzyme
MNIFNQDHWLSSILGKNVFQIDSRLISQLADSHLPKSPALLMAKVAITNFNEFQRLQEQNFYLVDTNVQLHKLRDKSIVQSNKINVRFSNHSDQESILKIAGNSFTYDRFHNDILITQESANKIKVEWAKNYFRNARGNWMIVAEDNGIISGFLQLIHDSDGALIIDLIAVDIYNRHKGIAQKMICFAMQNCETKTEVVRVGTQLGNLPSISLYQKMGFSIMSAQYVFHRHI